jgi:hypothetical protein
MKYISSILSLILRFNRKKEISTVTSEEEAIGYEAFPSRYLDKILKNYRYSIKYFHKAEKISSPDM